MEKRKTPLKAIRAHCLGCVGGSPKEVKLCNIPECYLFGYRFGRNPSLKGKRGDGKSLEKYRLSQKKACMDKGISEDTPQVNGLV